jgi:hypothetical protein
MPTSLAFLKSKFDRFREIFAELIVSMEVHAEKSDISNKRFVKEITDKVVAAAEVGLRYSDQLLYLAEQSGSAEFRQTISDIFVRPITQLEEELKKTRKEKTLRNTAARKQVRALMKTRRAKLDKVVSCLRSKTVRFKGFRTKSTPLMNQLMRMYKNKYESITAALKDIEKSDPKLFGKLKKARKMLKLAKNLPELYAKINAMAPITPACALEERKQHIEAALKSANTLEMLIALMKGFSSKKSK